MSMGRRPFAGICAYESGVGMSRYDVCPRYPHGCFKCIWYLGTEHIFFCGAYNWKAFGAAVVEVEVKKEPEKERGAWWNGRKSR